MEMITNKPYKYYIGIGVLSILLALTLPYVWELFNTLVIKGFSIAPNPLHWYLWVAVGFVAFIIPKGIFFSKNILWLETFSHELTHIVVAMMFFRKVHSFHAEEGTGVVYTSGQASGMTAPMSLAPYCLPIFTYLLLALRCLISANGMWIFDILIGVTIAFHVNCFKHQTGNHQTDINRYPILFSYLYIYTARIINACIIIVAFFPAHNVFNSMWRLAVGIFDNAVCFMSLIF